MSQRFPVLEQLGEQLSHAVESAPPGRRLPQGALAVASAVLVAVAVAAGAVLLGRHSDHPPGPSDASSRAALLAQYAVLRRPQTAADRAEAGPAPRLPGRSGFGGGFGSRRGVETHYYRVRLTGLADYEDVPALTRVVSVDGIRVSLFVEHLVHRHALPKAIVSGNDPTDAARDTTRRQLMLDQQRANAQPAYVLYAQAERGRRGGFVALSNESPRFAGLAGVAYASLSGPGGRIIAVEPDGVARLSWVWPREFDSAALSYVPEVTVSATVHDNVAATVAPERFSGKEQIDPETVTRYASGGAVLARLTDPSNGAAVYRTTTYDGQAPGPETAQSREAERDPATPNRVVFVPNVFALRAEERAAVGPQFYFTVLLGHRTYFLRFTREPKPGCVTLTAHDATGMVLDPGDEPTVRGDTYEDGVPLRSIHCSGTYRISISVMGTHNRRYAPFGSASFTVRRA